MKNMYHILKLRKFCIDNGRFVSTAFKDNPAKRTCSRCNHQFHLQSQNCSEVLPVFNIVRNHSTNTQTELKSVTSKKKRKKRKLYVELLEVIQGSSSQKKASVSKLKAKDLSLLINQSQVDLPEVYNLKINNSVQNAEISDCSNINLSESVSEEEKANDELFAKCAMISRDVFQGTSHECHDNTDELELDYENYQEINTSERDGNLKCSTENNDNCKIDVKDRRKVGSKASAKEKMRLKLKELDASSKENSLFQTTQSFMEICVNCNMLNRAMASLAAYRYKQKYSKREPVKHVIDLYNILLFGFARTAQLNKVNEVFKMICDDNINPNIQTYASCFECIGRLPSSENTLKHLKNYADHMFQRGYTLNDLGVKPVFAYDQREAVLKAISILEPGYHPESQVPNTCYSCSLLQELNTIQDKGFESPVEGIFQFENLKHCSRQQMEMEINDIVKVKTVEKRPEPNEAVLFYREKLQEAEENWKASILQAFHRDLKISKYASVKVQRNLNIYPYLKVLEPEQYVDIIMQEIRKLSEGSETFSPTMNLLCRSLGSRVQSRYLVKVKQDTGVFNKVEQLYDKYCEWYINPYDDSIKNTRHKWQHLINEIQDGPSAIIEERLWPRNILLEVGRFLYNIIMKDIKINVNVIRPNSKKPHFLPAFYPLFRYHGRMLKQEVKPHPILSRLFRSAAQDNLIFETTTVPMLSPPLPWTSIKSGGYLIAKVNMVRMFQETCQQMTQLEEAPEQQLYPSFDSLNQLGSIPWIVNTPILDTVIEVFNSGGSKKLDIPEPPSACDTVEEITTSMDKEERYQIYRKRMLLKRQKLEMYSLWCDALYRLSLANHFRDKVFWLPHNMDFRGRVYPCPPHLNHLGSDMARSLLCFAKGKPLGPNGFDWLKIHLINLTGLKKRDSLEERLKFANEKMSEILDSAENPLTGKMWWAESEEPWQTLSCCMEIAKVVKCGNPENYVCHFPVHQDGSCNGLQHYAALGRDAAGAESVNLAPSLYPQDVYSCVAQLVEKERSKDADNGVEIAQVLEGFIQRKVIKQTVMTTVYGVTKFGARLQIARQLKDLDDFPKEYVWAGSLYLVGKTFESLREMFTSTKEIQDWFTECAKQISHVLGKNVEWITPLGLPVVQPYSRNNKFITNKQQKLSETFSIDTFERPNVMKQKNAFPPNFIHSLDSSHMMLTSIFCERNKITFVSVHDCYWTHPSTVNIMNKICRQQFVALHSEPILESLSEYFVNYYIKNESSCDEIGTKTAEARARITWLLKQLPEKGTFNLDKVLNSVYFFS